MHRLATIAVVMLILFATSTRGSVTAQESSLRDLLPTADDLGPGFLNVADRTRPLEEQATGFADAGEAARLLAGWAWQENVYQRFDSAALSPAGYPLAAVEISLTRFASAQAAADAMAYFLQDRTAVLGQRETPAQALIGDAARAVTGPVNGAADDTLYVRSGPLLLRVSVASAEGAPAPSAEEIARGIIGRAGEASPPIVMMQPAGALPETLPLDDAACFGVAAEGELNNEQIATLLAAGAGALPAIAALGWQDGAYRQFACDPPPGRAGWVDISVHRFRDAAAATDAVASFAASRGRGLGLAPAPASALGEERAALSGPAVNGTEYTLYLSHGPLLFAVTGVAPDGDPRADVEAIATALLTPATAAPAVEIAAPTPTPYTLVAAPLPAATAPPAPTATFALPPTLIPVAIPTATPTAIPTIPPTAVPTSPPLPTATTGPLPTATPRVIHLPTPTPEGG